MPEIAWRGRNVYDVRKLWELTKNIPEIDIDIRVLKHNLDKDYWTVIDKITGKENYVTPNQVIQNQKISPEDYRKILEANLSYAVIIHIDSDNELDILDGLHRLSKVVMNKHTTIKAKILTDEILSKARIKKNGD